MRHVMLVSAAFLVAAPPIQSSESASVAMDEAIAVYGPGIFPAITRMEICDNFRVMIVYWAGTDMLFVDETSPSEGQSTMAVKRGFSISQFNYYEDSNSIKELSCKKSKAVLRITGKATSGHTSETYSFRITMDTLSGAYKYSDTQRRRD